MVLYEKILILSEVFGWFDDPPEFMGLFDAEILFMTKFGKRDWSG